MFEQGFFLMAFLMLLNSRADRKKITTTKDAKITHYLCVQFLLDGLLRNPEGVNSYLKGEVKNLKRKNASTF